MEMHRRTALFMDTLVVLQARTDAPRDAIEGRMARAFAWFAAVERICSRFDPESEVMQLRTRIGTPVPVSAILFSAIEFALTVARACGGAFDPTIGQALEVRGFNRNYRTGRAVVSDLPPAPPPTYRDVHLDPEQRTVTLRTPLVLDLGAVAKGLAIDLAAKELSVFGHYTVEAGGDLYAGGRNAADAPWHVGIRHPRQGNAIIETVGLSDAAICTSGDYERAAPTGADGHHLLDPRTGKSPNSTASVSVIAPTAMAADALSTAAFVLGPTRGLRLLAQQGVAGLVFSSTLERHATPDFERYLR